MESDLFGWALLFSCLFTCSFKGFLMCIFKIIYSKLWLLWLGHTCIWFADTFLLLRPTCVSQSLGVAVFLLGFHQVELPNLLSLPFFLLQHCLWVLYHVVDLKVLCTLCMGFSAKEMVIFHCNLSGIQLLINITLPDRKTSTMSSSCWLHRSCLYWLMEGVLMGQHFFLKA